MTERVRQLLADHHFHDAGLAHIRLGADCVEMQIELPESDPRGGVVVLTIWPQPADRPDWVLPAELLTVELDEAGPTPILRWSGVPDAQPGGFVGGDWIVERADVRWLA